MFLRGKVKTHNKELNTTAYYAGVKNFGKFNNAGYLGLYGMNKSRVQQRKQMGKDDVLDRAGATELAANLFRITQTDEKLILPIWLSEEKLESPSRTLLERTQRKQLAPKFVRGLDN